ncbi:hypothetical protein ACIRP7_23150 [Streptomyces sp. NPDC102270]|uniref:hypothetical protein n=1 Tax=Streptomyces sp. NPDC102270 TaxID=3366150 RepID=UPI003825A667
MADVVSRMIHCAGTSHPGPKAPLLRGETCNTSAGSSGGSHLVGVTTTDEELAGGQAPMLYAA